jgi:hypothetical protein
MRVTQNPQAQVTWSYSHRPTRKVNCNLHRDLESMNATSFFDADLVRRYDRVGPRYTSYPTAVQFSPNYGAGEYRRCSLLRRHASTAAARRS